MTDPTPRCWKRWDGTFSPQRLPAEADDGLEQPPGVQPPVGRDDDPDDAGRDERLDDPHGSLPVPNDAYDLLVDRDNCRFVNLWVVAPVEPGRKPPKRPFFNMGTDFIRATTLIRSLLSRRELEEKNIIGGTKLAKVPITYGMLGLTLCVYVKNAYTMSRTGGNLNAVPTKSVRRLLHHYGFTRVDGSHVRVLRDTLKTLGLFRGDGRFFTGRREQFEKFLGRPWTCPA